NCPHDAPLEETLPSVLGGGPSEGGPPIFGNDPDDAGSTSTVEDEGVEQPPAAAEPEKYVWQPAVTGDAEEDVEPSTTAGDDGKRKGREKPKPCGGNETTGGDAEKDIGASPPVAVDGKSKGTKPCDGKKGGATNPEPPELSKEQRGGTTQGGDNCVGIHGPCRGESTAQKENPSVQKEAPPLEQPRRGADEQNHRPPLEVTGLSKGGV
ncbi:MAG: hypothetical protein M3360_06370, partial [Actinomycetota bacterium]|nr:hypothetical protein [Actinomycetota bacterium]